MVSHTDARTYLNVPPDLAKQLTVYFAHYRGISVMLAFEMLLIKSLFFGSNWNHTDTLLSEVLESKGIVQLVNLLIF